MASQSDRYALYLRSVQVPEHEVHMFDRFYKAVNGRPPVSLREDFCGTGAVSVEWAQKKGRYAIGVDLDPEPLSWGLLFNAARLSPEEKKRLLLVRGDVRTLRSPPVDVLAAQNFSFFIFKQRQELLRYFQAAYSHLKKNGIFVLDMMGGSELMTEGDEEERRVGRGITYVWEHERFDPITHDARFHIHFRFDDGSALERAFTYDWRLWTLPEVRELLEEAGFSRSDVYWEGERRGRPSGIYRRQTSAEPDPAWVAYVVGVK